MLNEKKGIKIHRTKVIIYDNFNQNTSMGFI
ncbi:Uncharacterised protein [Clostridium putrefaciens]|uniref:Uncharacterized protein n=1 Tax=Clostridium putrefaciens TaxID=99675 RepID=A0A381J9Z3_9CLOT|nr:Uncharacterised protein [Clostridium putrefaciens]